MGKHAFKVGDRVIVYTRLKYDCVEGQKGFIRERNCEDGVRVSFDNGKYNRIGEDIWYVHNNDLTHDTDFQVGDWVRYEGVEDGHVPELEGEVGIVTRTTGFSTVGVKFPAHWNPYAIWNKANLVKIQPPQEESDNTIVHVLTSYTNKEEKKMDIRRKADGAIVRDVKETHEVGYKWVKYSPDCRTEYSEEYWEPVEEWVKIEVRKSQWETINTQIGTFEAWGVDQNYHTVSWRPAK